MGLLLLYFFIALGISFLCSILEAVLLSTPMSFITMKEQEGVKAAQRLKKYKIENERPLAAILSLNTIAHTIGAAGVGAQSNDIFGDEYFGITSAILTLLILVLSEIIPKNIGANYWRQ
jgi:Mg2+/Co2+ transporter CorB